jgi:hypothetical protein
MGKKLFEDRDLKEPNKDISLLRVDDFPILEERGQTLLFTK